MHKIGEHKIAQYKIEDTVQNFNKTCLVADLGLLDYEQACVLQRRLVAARKAGLLPDVLLLCQHPHVITLGRRAKREHLLGSARLLTERGVAICESDRGGDVTYHGPGQLVGYPILNLAGLRKDVMWYLQQLEEVMIGASADFGIPARRLAGKTGVWVDVAGRGTEKLAAIGVHLSRWVSSHGFAYNVSTDLGYFDLIVPCGIPGCRAVSLEKLTGRSVDFGDATRQIVARFGQVFGFEMRCVSRQELETQLDTENNAAHNSPHNAAQRLAVSHA
jgi:lipoyl(octanoyl) transferase